MTVIWEDFKDQLHKRIFDAGVKHGVSDREDGVWLAINPVAVRNNPEDSQSGWHVLDANDWPDPVDASVKLSFGDARNLAQFILENIPQ